MIHWLLTFVIRSCVPNVSVDTTSIIIEMFIFAKLYFMLYLVFCSLIDNERTGSPRSNRFSSSDVLTRYATQTEIDQWLRNTASACGGRCKLMDIGGLSNFTCVQCP